MTISQQDCIHNAAHELTDSLVYRHLSGSEPDAANRELLSRLAEQEKAHSMFWRELAGGGDVRPSAWALKMVPFLRRALGLTFTIKLFERGEHETIETYENKMLPAMPEPYQSRFRAIIDEEHGHAAALVERIKDKRLEYVGFIALGLADAIVELTGVNAGFLGVTGSTRAAGISSLIVGFAAAISMGSAAYLQSKQNAQSSPAAAAASTGIAYLIAVLLLALPYFLINGMFFAFAASTLAGFGLLAALTYYSAVVFERKFVPELVEAALLMTGTAVATYLLGAGLNRFFHINTSAL
jgi:VIT1/CCC1 family predicted Fe2+/Mn2+ transporter